MAKKTSKPNAKLREKGKSLIDKIGAASKLEKDWLDDAAKAVRAYTNEEKAEGEEKALGNRYDFNILFANVETIVPAVINSSPVPDIRRRFNDADPAARVVADLMERAISVQIDDSRLQIELEAAAQDTFLAGRGIVRIRFKSDIVGGEPSKDDLKAAANDAERGDDGIAAAAENGSGEAPAGGDYHAGGSGTSAPSSIAVEPSNSERLENERICFEAVSWKDYRHGPAKRWEDRPWDAFRFVIPKEDEEDSFDSAMIRSQFDESETNAWSKSEGDICGWEFWDKKTRKVYFVNDDGVLLKTIDDPLGLSGFLPIPTPMQPIEITGRLKPVNPFSIYRKLADQLDTISKRIDVVTKAMKIRGWYSGDEKALEGVLALEDNEFLPIPNGELYANSQGGIAGAMAFWPIEKFVAVLRELYAAREQTKQAIYEITGISDIVRGASSASETATAQNIKSQWGSLRIQKMQRMMERCARDLFVMMSEIIPTRFSLKTLEQMTGIPLIPTIEDTPEQRDAKAKVTALMRQRLASYYRIDVESDSTIRADLTRQKQEVAQFLQGASSYFAAVAPLVQQGALPADAAVEIFASTSRMFNLGKSVEDTLEKMVTDAKAKAQQPQQEKPDPAMVKAQTEQAKAQADMQSKQVDAQIKMQEFEMRRQEFEAKARVEMSKAQADGHKAQIEAAIKVMDQKIKEIDLQIKQVELQRAMSAPDASAEAHKPPSESIAFKDLPPEGQAQMAAQAGIILSPQQMADHRAALDKKEADKAAAKAKKEPA